MSFFDELKRRNVFRVGIAYVVAAWVLLQVVDLVFEYIAAPAWIMQLFMLALVIGLPLVLILAWVFELTPEGIKLETAVDPTQSVAPQTGRKLDRVIILFLVLAVAFLVADRFITENGSGSISPELTQESEGPGTGDSNLSPASNEAPHTDKSIAVLPLVNRSVQAEDAFFAEGLHDELLTQLSRISALKVISRTSVMGYAGTTKRMPEIGRELGVATLLEGGVQRSGNRVRINVQLIDAATDEHLWAEVYDRELTADNLFDIQSNITRAIAGALQAVLTGEEQQTLEQKLTDNVEAYSFYLRGKATARGFGRRLDEIDKSITFYQSAIDLDPQFAAAYAALAIDWTERYWGSEKLGDDLQKAHDALEQAKVLAPESSETLTAEGYYPYWGHLDYLPAIAAFDGALRREPGNHLALRGKAYALRRQGRLDESITAMETIISLDPLYGGMLTDLGYSLLHSGKYEQAKVLLNRAVSLGAKNTWNIRTLASSLVYRGELEQAWQTLAPVALKGIETDGSTLDLLLLIARAQANADRIDQVLDNYLSTDTQNSLGRVFSRALVYIQQGRQNELNRLIADLQESLQTARRERPDAITTLLGFVQLYGLQKDQVKLAEAVEAYYAAVKPDALRIVENRTIPTAYAIAGDSEAFLAYLDELIGQYGPWEHYHFTLDPAFNGIRDLPRFKAYDKQYRQWLEQLQ